MPPSQESFNIPLPREERTCADPNSLLFATACGTCGLAKTVAGCDILQLAERSAGQTQQTTILEQERDVALGEIQNLRTSVDVERRLRIEDQRDPVIPGWYTSLGIMARLRAEPELAADLKEGRAGLVYIDIRGLHRRNDDFSREAGDHDLRTAASRLETARTTSGPVQRDGLRLETAVFQAEQLSTPERRRHPSATSRDIGYRGNGADELVVLVRGVNTRELKAVADRATELFSVERAMQDSAEGHLPLVASVTYAHVSEIELEYDDAVDIFRVVQELASRRHTNLKSIQYAEMWDMARDAARAQGRTVRKPDDARRVLEKFIEFCCPDFAANERQYYTNQGIEVSEPQSRIPKRGRRSI
jgi:hypothetical protein